MSQLGSVNVTTNPTCSQKKKEGETDEFTILIVKQVRFEVTG